MEYVAFMDSGDLGSFLIPFVPWRTECAGVSYYARVTIKNGGNTMRNQRV